MSSMRNRISREEAYPRIRETEAPAASSKRTVHLQRMEQWIPIIVVAGILCGSLGILYFNGCAQLAQQGSRRIALTGMLKTEREKSALFSQALAQVDSPAHIEAMAMKQGMVPGDPQQAVILKESNAP